MSTLPEMEAQVTRALERAALTVDSGAIPTLGRYLDALLGTSEVINLTRILDPEEAIARHLVEPLAGWARLQDLSAAGPLIDLGSGGGAPGLPIAIATPLCPVTLVESRARKAAFLQEMVDQLDLSHVRVVHDRAESLGHGPLRATFQFAVARALAPLPVALELLLPLVEIGGVAAVYSGPAVQEHLPAATAVAADLGSSPPSVIPSAWPGGHT